MSPSPVSTPIYGFWACVTLVKDVEEAFADANANASLATPTTVHHRSSHHVKELIRHTTEHIRSLDAAALLALKRYFETTKHFCYAELASIVVFYRVVTYMKALKTHEQPREHDLHGHPTHPISPDHD
ncbi:hypothetical protein FRB97_006006 [Tulasnella sp. 331]|nr:hypothetical protein FRB97_006006 [Tulasnella sp. 331]